VPPRRIHRRAGAALTSSAPNQPNFPWARASQAVLRYSGRRFEALDLHPSRTWRARARSERGSTQRTRCAATRIALVLNGDEEGDRQ
jgi:hypothetical protein